MRIQPNCSQQATIISNVLRKLFLNIGLERCIDWDALHRDYVAAFGALIQQCHETVILSEWIQNSCYSIDFKRIKIVSSYYYQIRICLCECCYFLFYTTFSLVVSYSFYFAQLQFNYFVQCEQWPLPSPDYLFLLCMNNTNHTNNNKLKIYENKKKIPCRLRNHIMIYSMIASNAWNICNALVMITKKYRFHMNAVGHFGMTTSTHCQIILGL